MDKLDPKADGASKDITAENIEALKRLFPECVTEGKVDFEVLRELLGDEIDDRPERYSFTWNGKSLARRIAQTPSTGTLRPCPEESVNWDTTQNLFIEGDNLEVLKLLQKSYHKRVKLIFIDPPYNTGNEFIYPDKYQDNLDTYLRYTGQIGEDGFKLSANVETSGRYHTNWLNMMWPRLKLARNLLSPNGAIFATIDDHEVANLRNIMDEIWGEENFVASIAWQKVFAKKNKALISGSHDHVLVYVRDIEAWSRNLLPRDEEQLSAFKNPDNDNRGRWQSVAFSVQSEDSERRKEYRYEITLPSGRKVLPPTGRHWNGLYSRYEELRRDGRLWFGPDGDNPPRQKTFLSEVQQGIVPDTWWRHEDAGNNQEAKKEILDLFGDSEPYSTPKPTKLITRILQIATTDGDDIVLDFFAGSGTTGHSVIDLNAADNGRRRFILIQLPEGTGRKDYKTIAEITKERIRRVIQRKKNAGPAVSVQDGDRQDLGFRVFKLDSSNVCAWKPDSEDLGSALLDNIQPVKLNRSELDVLCELLLKFGLDLAVPIEERSIDGKTVYIVGAGALIVCLADGITLDLVEGIAALKAELEPEIMRVVFKDAGFPDDVVKTNTVQILRQAGIDDVKSL